MEGLKRNVDADIYQELPKVENLDRSKIREVADYLKGIPKDNRVLIIGDYDADGICSSLILKNVLDYMGIKNKTTLPSRETEGYGISEKISRGAKAFDTVICTDNGLNENDAIKSLKRWGVDVVVLDHHELEGKMPNAKYIVTPEKNGTPYCATGLAYLLAEEVITDNKELLDKMSVLGAIGTVGDMVDLVGENREIVKKGLNAINEEGIMGATLKQLTNKKEVKYDTEDIAFYVSPAINSYGRTKDDGAKYALEELERCINDKEYFAKRGGLKYNNDNRKKIVKALKESLLVHTKENLCPVIATSEDYRNPENNEVKIKARYGCCGLLAQQYAREVGLPTIVLKHFENEGIYRGSGRTFGDYDLNAFLQENKDIIENGGGHKASIGITIKEENFEKLCERAKEVNIEVDETKKYDVVLKNGEQEKWLSLLKEKDIFGQGNKMPTFLLPMNLGVKREYPLETKAGNTIFHTKLDDLSVICFDSDKSDILAKGTVDDVGILLGKITLSLEGKPQFIVNDVASIMPKDEYEQIKDEFVSDLSIAYDTLGREDVSLKDLSKIILEKYKEVEKEEVKEEVKEEPTKAEPTKEGVFIELEFSESNLISNVFEEYSKAHEKMSFALANAIIGYFDNKANAERDNAERNIGNPKLDVDLLDDLLSYHKTYLYFEGKVDDFTFERERPRFDVGDGFGDLIGFTKDDNEELAKSLSKVAELTPEEMEFFNYVKDTYPISIDFEERTKQNSIVLNYYDTDKKPSVEEPSTPNANNDTPKANTPKAEQKKEKPKTEPKKEEPTKEEPTTEEKSNIFSRFVSKYGKNGEKIERENGKNELTLNELSEKVAYLEKENKELKKEVKEVKEKYDKLEDYIKEVEHDFQIGLDKIEQIFGGENIEKLFNKLENQQDI